MLRVSTLKSSLLALLLGLCWVGSSPSRINARVTLPCGNPPGAAVSFRTSTTNESRSTNCQEFLRCEIGRAHV